MHTQQYTYFCILSTNSLHTYVTVLISLCSNALLSSKVSQSTFYLRRNNILSIIIRNRQTDRQTDKLFDTIYRFVWIFSSSLICYLSQISSNRPAVGHSGQFCKKKCATQFFIAKNIILSWFTHYRCLNFPFGVITMLLYD